MPVTLDSRHHHGRPAMHEVEASEDGLIFGDFCFSCGNATQGTPYCSKECRESDSQRPFGSLDFSPSLGPVPPPLISSAKSTSSTPPSSANNSPLPLNGMMGNLSMDDEDPPRLDLPASASKFAQFGTAVPIAVRQPGLDYGVTYTPEVVAYPGKVLKVASVEQNGPSLDDLMYRRKPGVPASKAVPAPLYFRQSAAAAHSSPGLIPTSSPSINPTLLPSSPPKAGFSPRLSAAKASVSVANVSAFALPPPAPRSASPSPNATHPRRKSDFVHPASADARPSNRRASWNGPNDLLMSPRIRALRHEDTVTEGEEEPTVDEEVFEEDEQNHSAFAQYLFSHVSESTTPSSVDATARSSHVPSPDEKRSISADPVLQPRGRAHRFLFGRGSAAGNDKAEDESEEVAAVDADKTPMRPRLTPGNFISATTGTPMSSTNPSPFPSPPASPPTFQRGRSNTRRPSDVSVAPLNEADPRGRSKLRGLGAVKRSQSPHRDASVDQNSSRSRGRRDDVSPDRGRQASRSSARSDRSETRNRAGSPSRGRGRRSDLRDIPGSLGDEHDDEEEERGRRGRSKSLLRRGRGREVAISGAAYGHYESP